LKRTRVPGEARCALGESVLRGVCQDGSGCITAIPEREDGEHSVTRASRRRRKWGGDGVWRTGQSCRLCVRCFFQLGGCGRPSRRETPAHTATGSDLPDPPQPDPPLLKIHPPLTRRARAVPIIASDLQAEQAITDLEKCAREVDLLGLYLRNEDWLMRFGTRVSWGPRPPPRQVARRPRADRSPPGGDGQPPT